MPEDKRIVSPLSTSEKASFKVLQGVFEEPHVELDEPDGFTLMILARTEEQARRRSKATKKKEGRGLIVPSC